jgi:hypothetical protein
MRQVVCTETENNYQFLDMILFLVLKAKQLVRMKPENKNSYKFSLMCNQYNHHS